MSPFLLQFPVAYSQKLFAQKKQRHRVGTQAHPPVYRFPVQNGAAAEGGLRNVSY